MLADGVRYVIERLRAQGIDARSDKGPPPHRADAPARSFEIPVPPAPPVKARSAAPPFEGALIPITFDTLQEASSWAQVAVEDYRRLDAYLRSIEPDLPEHYGMSADGVRYVIERLLAQGMEARRAETPEAVPCEARQPAPEGDAP